MSNEKITAEEKASSDAVVLEFVQEMIRSGVQITLFEGEITYKGVLIDSLSLETMSNIHGSYLTLRGYGNEKHWIRTEFQFSL